MAKRLRNPAFKGSDATINTKWHYLRNHCFSEKTSTLNLHSTLASLCKCHACFIYKYMYWMYSIYESVGVRWSWHVVVINKWKALPCVSGGESQSLGSSLQHNSPEKHTVYTEYIYTYTYKKTVPAWSGSVWWCFIPIPVMRPVLHCAIRHPHCHMGVPAMKQQYIRV